MRKNYFKDNITLYNGDCIKVMDELINKDIEVNFTLTDIPYNVVSRKDNGLRSLDKKDADILTFDIDELLDRLVKITKGAICIFCGKEQFSYIYEYFAKLKGTTRPIVWEKSNPSPMNGQYVYLSGVELAIWYKPRKATFKAHCKNTVFKYPNGSSKFHPTAKNLKLFKDLILDNTNENDVILDCCVGSGTTLLAARELNRKAIGIEISKKYCDITVKRLEGENNGK